MQERLPQAEYRILWESRLSSRSLIINGILTIGGFSPIDDVGNGLDLFMGQICLAQVTSDEAIVQMDLIVRTKLCVGGVLCHIAAHFTGIVVQIHQKIRQGHRVAVHEPVFLTIDVQSRLRVSAVAGDGIFHDLGCEGGHMEMETVQIKGVDSTNRKTKAKLADRSTLIIHEKIMTHGTQFAETHFEVDMDGEDCGCHVVSRSVAKEESKQYFYSKVNGNARSSGHTECDAIIMDNAKVVAVPQIEANHTEASLIHEAAIGKIAGEQLIKLMTLGLTEKEAEEQIINGFLK